jgi:hypothetical protein
MHIPIFYLEGQLKTYSAFCHCQNIQYKVTIPSLDISAITICNCTFCSYTATLQVMAWGEDIQFEAGEDMLRVHEFGKRRMIHKLCPKCSANPFTSHERK